MAIVVVNNSYTTVPKGTTAQRPSSPTAGMIRFNTETNSMESYDSVLSSWTRLSPPGSTFRFRTIITRGYMLCGYKDSSPWRNVNRTNHSTDITTNLGDVLDYAAGYAGGGFSDYYAYVYSADNTVGGASTNTSSFNMATEAGRSHNASWDTKYSRSDLDVLINPNWTIGYIVGGGYSEVDKHNYVTEVMYSAGSIGNAPSGGGTGGGIGVFYGEKYGWVSSGTSVCGYLTFSSETWSSGGISWATDGQPKGLSSKHGYGYGGIGSYAGSLELYKFNDKSGSLISTLSRAGGTQGEENLEMGQDWGYQIGGYNGSSQNNISWKLNYITDVFTLGGSDMQPKGHDGASSGATASASSQILGGI